MSKEQESEPSLETLPSRIDPKTVLIGHICVQAATVARITLRDAMMSESASPLQEELANAFSTPDGAAYAARLIHELATDLVNRFYEDFIKLVQTEAIKDSVEHKKHMGLGHIAVGIDNETGAFITIRVGDERASTEVFLDRDEAVSFKYIFSHVQDKMRYKH